MGGRFRNSCSLLRLAGRGWGRDLVKREGAAVRRIAHRDGCDSVATERFFPVTGIMLFSRSANPDAGGPLCLQR